MSARTALRCTLAFFAALLLSVSANAQLFRAYLAPTGLDTNPCTLPQPCRLLPAALAAVADGGEIWMLDSANYNTATVNITKSVTILAVPGVVGSVLATGGDAINIATAGVKVTLRNLVIVPFPGGGGVNGIVMTNGASLTVENCMIAGFTGRGINFATGGRLFLSDSIVRNTGEAGVHVQTASGLALASIDRSRFENNTFNGVVIATNAQGAISNSVAAHNGSVGFLVDAGGKAMISDCRISDIYDSAGDFGILVRGNGSHATVSRCDVFGPFDGFRAEGTGALLSVSDSTAQSGGAGFTSDSGAVVNVERSTANRCQVGMRTIGASTLRVTASSSVNNTNRGFYNDLNQGTFESRGNNTVRGNTNGDLSGVITVIGGN